MKKYINSSETNKFSVYQCHKEELVNSLDIKIINIKKYIEKLNIKLFDVSLRDGLQGLPIEYHEIYTTEYKKKIFDNIIFNYNPINIEIGSIINPKIMPILKDSIELFRITSSDIFPYSSELIFQKSLLEVSERNNVNNNLLINNKNIFLLIPNKNNLLKAIENNIMNYSFITSVSNSFQYKNIKKNIYETKNELKEMMNIINKNIYSNDFTSSTEVIHGKDFIELNKFKKNNIKLYISCINECPIEGKIDNDFIVEEIIYYYKNLNIDIYCLCDTCATLDYLDYKYIIDNLIKKSISLEKISLHLHIDLNKNISNIENIIFYSLDNNIKHFDISLLEFGGCSLTIQNNNLHQNLSYNLFFDIIQKYIDYKNTNK